jgi:hypothetical protein
MNGRAYDGRRGIRKTGHTFPAQISTNASLSVCVTDCLSEILARINMFSLKKATQYLYAECMKLG